MPGTTNYPSTADSHTGGNPFGFAEVGNLVSTRLNGAISNSATTITVDSTTGFASRGIIVIGSEVITYTGKTATTFTGCTRGAGGTSAAAHLSRRSVSSVPVAANHNDLAAAIVAIETKLGASSSTSGAGIVSPTTNPGDVLYVSDTLGRTAWGPAAAVKIAEAIATSSAVAAFDFTGIPSRFAGLQIQAQGRGESTAPILAFAFQFGSGSIDTSTAYDYRQMFTSTSGAVVAAGLVGSTYIHGGGMPGSTGAAGKVGRAVYQIYDYASTARFKGAVGIGYTPHSDTAVTEQFMGQTGGQWRSTAAIDTIRTSIVGGTNFAIGSRVSIWGMP